MPGLFELKKTAAGKFHFVLKAGNNEVILQSELYDSKAAAEKGVASIKANAGNDARFDRRTSKRGEPYFVLKAANGEVIGTSEMYTAEAGRDNGIASVKKNGPTGKLKDLTEAAPAPAAKAKTQAKAAPKTTTAKAKAAPAPKAEVAAAKPAAKAKAAPKKAAAKATTPKAKAAPKKAAPPAKAKAAPKKAAARPKATATKAPKSSV